MSHDGVKVVDRRPGTDIPIGETPALQYDQVRRTTSDPDSTRDTFDPPEKSPNRVQTIDQLVRPWTPIPLRRWYAISLLSFMVLVAVALEIALHFSRVQNGWKVTSALAATTGIMHFIYTLPPVAVAMIIVALWTWTDIDIKKTQPYIDLAYGNAPASKSILLDYSTKHAAIVSVSAYRRSHYIVAASSLMVLVGLAMQPLAASLFTVKQTWWSSPNINVTSFQDLGLEPTFGDLTAFTTAAGFVQASVRYNVTPPNFVRDVWAISKIEVPSDQVANGTMFVNTTSVRTVGHCKAGETGSLTPFANGTGFTMSGTSNGCSVSIPVQANNTVQSGVDVVTCPGSPPPDPFKPAVFWTFTQSSPSDTPAYSLVFCSPTIELLNVTALVSLQTGDLQSAAIVANFSQPNNITDPNGIVQGRAMNGVAFNLSGADSSIQQRAQMATAGLTAAILEQAQSSGSLQSQIQSFGMIAITESIYHLYLSLVAKEIYFVPATGFMEVGIKTFQPRLFIVDVTAHIMTGVLLAFACIGACIHIWHYRTRDLVVLPRRPGTLASAAAFTARSNVGDLIDGYLDDTTLERLLKDKRFTIDKQTGRIVMADQEYGNGTTLERRRGVFGSMRSIIHR